MFHNTATKSLSRGEFKNFKEFALTVKNKDTQRLIKASAGMVEGVPTSGGFLVPEEFTALFIDKTIEDSVVLPGCTIFPMKSNRLIIPAFDNHDHSKGIFGGVAAGWGAEADVSSIKIPKLRGMELAAKLLVLFTAASTELTEDAPDFESNLEVNLAKAMAWQLDYALINGTGSSQPLGILNASSTITVSKAASQAPGTLLYANITAMVGSLHPKCFEQAVWICHPSCLPQLLELNLPIGQAGSIVPAFT